MLRLGRIFNRSTDRVALITAARANSTDELTFAAGNTDVGESDSTKSEIDRSLLSGEPRLPIERPLFTWKRSLRGRCSEGQSWVDPRQSSSAPVRPLAGIWHVVQDCRHSNCPFSNSMHCPYCAAELVDAAAGELRCLSTGSLLSRSIRTQFETAAVKEVLQRQKAVPFNLGRWFCPCCSRQTENGVCTNCSFVFTASLVRELIELNPHVGTYSAG
jgi:hypothetical protein